MSVFVINKDYFEKLPAEYQTIISEEAKNSEEFAHKKLSEMEGDMLAELEQNGMEITTLTADEQTSYYDYTLDTDPQIQRAVSCAQQLTGVTTVGGVNDADIAADSAAASSEAAAESTVSGEAAGEAEASSEAGAEGEQEASSTESAS